MSSFDSMFEGLFENNDEDIAAGAMESTVGDDFAFLDEGAAELTPAAESAIFLETLMDSFDDPNEFADYAMENAVYWETYGLIDNATEALEAVKKFQVDNWKQVNFERLWKRECIRIEARKDTTTWKKYALHRGKMREARDEIFRKNKTQAMKNVRAAQANSKRKVASMNTSGSKDLQSRLNKSISKSTSGKDPTTGKPS